MPYKIVRKGKYWYVINKLTGKNHGKSTSSTKAKAQMRLLYSKENK